MIELTGLELGLIPLNIAVTQFFKNYISTKFHPTIALIFGIILTIIVALSVGTLGWITLLKGLVIGLSAAGLYDQKNN